MDFIFNLAINCFDFIIIYKYLNTFFGEKKYSTKNIFMYFKISNKKTRDFFYP